MLQTTHQQLLNNTLLGVTSTSSEVQLSVIRTGKGEMWVNDLERYPAQKTGYGNQLYKQTLATQTVWQ